ncbi:hypothetical protein [Flavobacterium sp. ACN6]|nr:hypothetical protein [Flavobacterium sp. ACN6]
MEGFIKHNPEASGRKALCKKLRELLKNIARGFNLGRYVGGELLTFNH